MNLRLLTTGLVVGAAVADAVGGHELAYYLLVPAIPIGAIVALDALGSVLDRSAAEPLDRVLAALSAAALPFLLLGTTVRAPLLENGPPPSIGVTCIVVCLAIFAVQALLRATVAVPSGLRAVARAAK